jgi:OmpA-OmpF porin, OOP family
MQKNRLRLALSTMATGVAALLLVLPNHADAQTHDTEVLRGKDVTAERVVEALSPDAVRTRSLRIGRTSTGAAPGTGIKPSASLLITFETNSSDLTANAKQQLDVVAVAMKTDKLANYRFNVEGHADARGQSQGNLVLSQERAGRVRDYLVVAHGIATERLVAEGRGDREPLRPGQPAAAENRRVSFVTVVP